MNKEDLAELIDAYADAKISKNRYLCQEMIAKLEETLSDLYARLDTSNEDCGTMEE